MKRFAGIILVLLIVTSFVSADDEEFIVLAFRKNFQRGSITTKIQILQDASDETDVDMGPLYLLALDEVIGFVPELRSDPVARDLSILTVQLIGISGNREALPQLWKLFMLDSSQSLRINVLNAIAALPPADPLIVASLNDWVLDQNDAYRNDETTDLVVLSESAITLGALGDISSFPVLFSASIAGYPANVAEKARTALYRIEGDFPELIVRVIDTNPLFEKLEALRISVKNNDLADETKARIAGIALRRALDSTPRGVSEREAERLLRRESVLVLTDYGWSESTADVIYHFNRTIEELTMGIGDTQRLLEAIDALGAMGTHEAAERLTLYQNVLNQDVENGKDVDEQVVLEVIANLSALGDKIAFETLLFVGILEYSDRVKRAADAAIEAMFRNSL